MSYKKYLESVSDPDNFVILATGRLRKKEGMLKNVMSVLNMHNVSFDEVHLNWGGDTFTFKINLFENIIKKNGIKEFVMYDDRYEHIVRFKEWADKQSIKITIVDILNKTSYTNI